ncbi:EsaB/YukD family protein [Mycolicibacterium vinylchloridicum]|uniref:EsaB/YukD family protein n=1 Tax=Mycolicibacterium vinylchloridicum TaxID=2736928 RepID=UPI0015C70D3B|nr:EsaB/YukD family protein [Mycolicibacterium vinylchloridicum]
MTAIDELRRLSIRAADREVDVVLPAHLPVAELVGEMVELVGGDEVVDYDPHLTRVSGEVLDPAMTLAQCAIRDGDLLLLTSVARPEPIPRFDASTAVIDVVASSTPTVPEPRERAAATIGVLSVALAGLAAALAAPGDLGAPGFLLAMSAMSATSLFVWRLLDCAPMVFLPLAAVTMTASAAAVGAVAGWWSMTAAGPILGLSSLALLALSARLSVRSSGLSTPTLPDADIEARTRTARQRLTMLVVTANEGAVLGAAVTAATTIRPLAAGVFVAVTFSALVLRACRTVRRWSLPRIVRRATAILDLAVAVAVVPSAAAAAGAFTTLPGFGQ